MGEHYYLKDGSPFYEVPTKTGGLRAVHIGDVRKALAVPSVTTVLNVIAKPALTEWMVNQGILAALTLPRIDGEAEAEWLKRVKLAAIEVDFPADRVIAREGEIGTGFFIVVEGRVKVVRSGTTVAHLGPGEFFGELSVLDGGPRVAMVATEVPTRCLAIASWDFERVLREEPGVALAVLRVVAARLRQVTTDHRT